MVVPDLYRGSGPGRGAGTEEAREAFSALSSRGALTDLGAVTNYIDGPSTQWSEPGRTGLLGVAEGGAIATAAAAQDPSLLALCLLETPLGDPLLEKLGTVDAPLLGIYAKDDDLIHDADVAAARSHHSRSEWVLYQSVARGFLDDSGGSFNLEASSDALGRMVEFYSLNLIQGAISS